MSSANRAAPKSNVRQVPAPVAALLAWVLPGLGHWVIGERARGIIFFTVITVTFWAGIAVGGVRTTITPRDNGAWIAAQLCTGTQAVAALYWSHHRSITYKEEIKAPWPASNISVVYAGVAGLLNVLVIIDVLARTDVRQPAIAARAPPNPRGKT